MKKWKKPVIDMLTKEQISQYIKAAARSTICLGGYIVR